MYILVLIISLHSQFNHALDIKMQDNIQTIETCNELGKTATSELQKLDRDVETKYFCQKNNRLKGFGID